ncbi:MAG: hypothetical protein H6922_00345 [Pseudomonadaceae bacterium]|nr:hypothetical protein [Pseudomonadaceae bacterium]
MSALTYDQIVTLLGRRLGKLANMHDVMALDLDGLPFEKITPLPKPENNPEARGLSFTGWARWARTCGKW